MGEKCRNRNTFGRIFLDLNFSKLQGFPEDQGSSNTDIVHMVNKNASPTRTTRKPMTDVTKKEEVEKMRPNRTPTIRTSETSSYQLQHICKTAAMPRRSSENVSGARFLP